jgi:hypothetical protein
LTALAGCSSGEPQDLRGPGPQKGQAFRSETKVVLTNGTVVVHAGAERLEGACSMTMTNIEDDEILAVEGRQVTKQRTTVITDDISRSVQIDGEKDSGTERGPLVGEKILCERKDGKWKNALIGKEPTEKQKKELKFFDPAENKDELYPEGKVKPGHTWKVDAAHLRKLLSPRCTALFGEASITFVRTTTLDGESCAVIYLSMNIKGRLLDDDNNEASITLIVKGPEYRSLGSGYNVKSSLSGTIRMTRTVVVEGERVPMWMSGPVTIETVTKLK